MNLAAAGARCVRTCGKPEKRNFAKASSSSCHSSNDYTESALHGLLNQFLGRIDWDGSEYNGITSEYIYIENNRIP